MRIKVYNGAVVLGKYRGPGSKFVNKHIFRLQERLSGASTCSRGVNKGVGRHLGKGKG